MRQHQLRTVSRFSGYMIIALLVYSSLGRPALGQSTAIEQALPKVAKVYGAGGLNRLESWQTGLLISSDGMIVTAWSYVLDSGATVVLSDGRRFQATLAGYHPRWELALLRIDSDGLDFFELDQSAQPVPGIPILAFSNLYGIASGNEQVSVQRGAVSMITEIATLRGPGAGGYQGPAIIVDAAINNPGAAGGAVTGVQGKLLGIIGRESRNASSNLWLNYAIPVSQVNTAVQEILNGQANQPMTPSDRPAEPVTLQLLGLVLVPDVAAGTPPWIEQVVANSPAAQAGLQPDDLIVEISGRPTSSRARVSDQLSQIDRDKSFVITIQRDDRFHEMEIRIDR